MITNHANSQEMPMVPKLGYLLPTREQIMQGRPEAGPLLTLAERAPRRWAMPRSGSAIPCSPARATSR